MKAKALSIVVLLPLVAVIILAIAGVTLSYWVYIILGITCPLVAAILWLLNKEMERKISDAGGKR